MLKQAAAHSGLAERFGDQGELGIVLVDQDAIAALNQEHLGHHGPTDVIAFDLADDLACPGDAAQAGEIYVCLDVAVEMGERLGTGTGYELVLYCVHGMLHLVGFDDHHPSDTERMRAAEKTIMERLRDIRDFRDIL